MGVMYEMCEWTVGTSSHCNVTSLGINRFVAETKMQTGHGKINPIFDPIGRAPDACCVRAVIAPKTGLVAVVAEVGRVVRVVQAGGGGGGGDDIGQTAGKGEKAIWDMPAE